MHFLLIANSPEQKEDIQKPHYNPHTACLIHLDFYTNNNELSAAFQLQTFFWTYSKLISYSEAEVLTKNPGAGASSG